MSTVVLLTRGDEHWGMGHLHRTSWLAAALPLQDQIAAAAVYCVDSPPARAFWRDSECTLSFVPSRWLTEPYTQISEIAGQASIVVIDWLDSDPQLVAALRDTGATVVLLDDYGPAQYQADLVVNALLAELDPAQTIRGAAHLYSGVKYVQLPPAVTRLRGVASATAKAMETELVREPPQPGPVEAVMVSFGGHEQPRLIDLALQALARADYRGRVIVMPGQVAATGPAELDIEMLPAGREFHSFLAAADIVICGGGLTLYEACFLGVPAVAVGVPSVVPGYEQHQQATAAKLQDAGCCRAAGMADQVTPEYLAGIIRRLIEDRQARGQMSARGMRLLDGRGLMRTVELILEHQQR